MKAFPYLLLNQCLVFMVVNLGFMGRMFVIMRPMFSRMIVIVHMDIPTMFVLVNMLVNMFMTVGVRMLVGVLYVPMRMLMAMDVGVLMGVDVFVFMFAFHNNSSFLRMLIEFFLGSLIIINLTMTNYSVKILS